MITLASLKSLHHPLSQAYSFRNYIRRRKSIFAANLRLRFDPFATAFHTQKYLFIHITKCGGTYFKSRIVDTSVCYRSGHNITFNSALPSQKLVFILRDPLERFTSAFYSRLSYSMNTSTPLTVRDAKFYQFYPTINDYVRALSGTTAERKRLLLITLRYHDHFAMWGSYFDYFPRDAIARIKQRSCIFRYSNLNSDISSFASRFSLNLSDDSSPKRQSPSILPKLDSSFTDFMLHQLRDEYFFYNSLAS